MQQPLIGHQNSHVAGQVADLSHDLPTIDLDGMALRAITAGECVEAILSGLDAVER
jgi:hypothetical protein